MGKRVHNKIKLNNIYKNCLHFLSHQYKKNSPASYSIQDLYDTTNIKNGIVLNEVASLVYGSKSLSIIADNCFFDLCREFLVHINSFGLDTFLYDSDVDREIKKSDIVFVLTLNENNHEELLNMLNECNVKVVDIISENNKEKKSKSDFTLYYLDDLNFDQVLCVDATLNCVGINVSVKFNNM